ncbi:MAG TPA: DoxX family protein [Lacipirellulaceae bacterium]|nr:DoxX family protein [Lacipirellulaceae bacterium]
MNEQPAGVRIVYRPALVVVVALVLLRLATGWHFYREGTKKLAYDPSTGRVRVAFSAEPMLRQAVGPLAERIQQNLPNFHDWESLLAVPRSAAEATEQAAERAAWESDYARRRKAAEGEGQAAPVEFAPLSPAGPWAARVSADWARRVAQFQAIPGISEEQQAAAKSALTRRQQQLADYLASEDAALVEWQHELWRLQQWEEGPEARELPFQSQRITEKRAETAAASRAWISQVRELEAALANDLRQTLTPEQAANSDMLARIAEVMRDGNERRLHRLNVAVTSLIIGVGACLLLGLFTRLAAAGGIAFLAMVIATQPPWVAGANTTVFYYQLVEIAALLVLFVVGAGRWFGLDFFLRALWARCCGRTETAPR